MLYCVLPITCAAFRPLLRRGDVRGVIRYPTPPGAVIPTEGRDLVVRIGSMQHLIPLAACSAFRFLTSHYSVVEAGGCCSFGMTGPLQIIQLPACAAFRPLLRRGDRPRSNPVPHTSGEQSFRPSQQGLSNSSN